MFTSMSGKNMFYDDDIHEGMVVAIDEFENADHSCYTDNQTIHE